MHITALSFQRRALFYFLLFAIVLGGIMAFRSISKLEDPELVVMQSQIVTIWPGASAHEVEMQVTNIIEQQLSTLANVESIRSRSSHSLSVITVTLELTVPQDEIEQRWDFLRRRIGEAEASLPAGVLRPVIYDDFGDVYGMFYAMTADGYSYREMSRMARFIKREMLAVKGVARVEVYGEQQPMADIVISPSGLHEMGVLPLQLIMALDDRSSVQYAGSMISGRHLLPLSAGSSISALDDLRQLKVKGPDGSMHRLGDLAGIQEAYPDPARNTLHVNNQKAIGISLSMESGENIIEVGKRVEKRLAELQENIPAGYSFHKVFFQPELVKKAINGFMWNLSASVLIVIVVLMLSMGWRSGLIIGVGLLLTILATFPILLAAGGTLQRISLGAFIVAMGMLVDNAIVVLDGILVDHKKGIPRPEALLNPAKRTAWPLFGATFIAVAAFLPVFLSKDAAGTYGRDLFVVLGISLSVSWFLAMTQVPLFARKWLRVKAAANEKETLFGGRFYTLLRKLLCWLLQHKTISLVVAFIMLLIAGLSFRHVKNAFFPDFNYNQVYVEYRLPAGTSPEKLHDDLQAISTYLLSLEEVKLVVSSHGQTPSRYCLVRPMGEPADNYGELIVNFRDYETMLRMRPQVAAYLHDHFPDARSRIRKYNLSIKSSHTVEVEFSGPDPAVLRQLAGQATERFRQNPFVDQYTLENDWEPLAMHLSAGYIQSSAVNAGISRQDISNALLMASDGLPLGAFYQGQDRIEMVLKLRDDQMQRLQHLDEIPVLRLLPDLSSLTELDLRPLLTGIVSADEVLSGFSAPIPLGALTDGMHVSWQEPVVRRMNGRRAIQVQCEPLDGYSPARVRSHSVKAMREIELPPGYSMSWVGEHELQHEALYNIFRYLPISVLLIIIALILLFNDFKKPFIVLICIPMAFIGIVPGMIISGQPFTFMAIVGSFGLMGMIVKNAIVLLDETEGLIATGMPHHPALIQATVSRTRPVLLASFTTILGMIPLLGDPMYASMAVAIISGLLVGTLITLLFVPLLYAAFFGIRPLRYSQIKNLHQV